jgi:VCBS repeat-containing protein
MDDGSTLWFSVVMDLNEQNLTNADFNFALGSDQFVTSDFGNRQNLVEGEAIGFGHNRGTIQGVYWQNTDADTVSERNTSNSSLSLNSTDNSRALIVGRIDWGTGGAGESLTLYAPGADLAQDTPILSITTPDLDQSQFDSVLVQFKDRPQLDEIRFGANYDDVLGPKTVTQDVTVTITGTNDAPVANNDPEGGLPNAAYTTDEDTVLTVKNGVDDVLANDTDVDTTDTISLVGNQTSLAGQLGVLDLTANGGINPETGVAWQVGDTYHLAFVTEGTRDATDPDIATYHAFVQAAAEAQGLGGATWYNIGQSYNDPVRNDNAPPMSTASGIFLMDGSTILADDGGADLANGPDVNFNITETGGTYNGNVATGSSRKFGDPTQSRIEHGNSQRTNGQWWQVFNGQQASQWHFYAISEALTITEVQTLVTTSEKGAAVVVNPDGSFTYDPTVSGTLQTLAVGEETTDTFTYTVADHLGPRQSEASENFEYLYEMDVNPATQDLDGAGAATDWFAGVVSNVSIPQNYSDGVASSDQSAGEVLFRTDIGGSIQRESLTGDFTIEVAARVLGPIDGGDVGGFGIALDPVGSASSLRLNIGLDNVSLDGDGKSAISTGLNSDAMHSYRIAYVAEEDVYWVWRDDQLLYGGAEGIAGTNGNFNSSGSFFIGDFSGSISGEWEVDHIRLADEAFSPAYAEDTATVTIAVTGTNDAPVANDDPEGGFPNATFTTDEDSVLSVAGSSAVPLASTDFDDSAIGGSSNIKTTLNWTVTGVEDPGDMAALNAAGNPQTVFDGNAFVQDIFIPGLNTGNGNTFWTTDVPITVSAGSDVTLTDVTFNSVSVSGSQVENVNRRNDYTVTLLDPSGGTVEEITVADTSAGTGDGQPLVTFDFADVALTESGTYTLRIKGGDFAGSGETGNHTGIDNLSINGTIASENLLTNDTDPDASDTLTVIGAGDPVGLAGQLGVLDPTAANGGINPETGQPWQEGDTYHLAFVTSGTRDATDPDIQTYHDFVQGAAAAQGYGEVTWYNIGQSINDPVREDNAPPMSTSSGIFLMDGSSVLADDGGADLANGPDLGFNITETGSTYNGNVATGGGRLFGDPNQPRIEHGNSTRTDGAWWRVFNGNQASQWHFYAISEPLTIQSVYSMTTTTDKGASVTVKADGGFDYDPTGSDELQGLAAGEDTTDTFTYTISDGNGGKDTATVTIAVNGVNDAPVITSGTQTVTIIETDDVVGGTDPDPDAATGTITFDDVDLSDVHTVTHDGGVVSGTTLANGLMLTPSQEAALLAGFSLDSAAGSGGTNVFINEIHYDNSGTDVGEFIEVAGTAGTDLGGWTLALYNGANGTVYNTINLSGTIDNESNGMGALAFALPTNGLQNGAPDGIALVDNNDNVIEFLSYEGTLTADGGPADGMTSTDIGVAEGSGTPAGESLQRTGTGSESADFTWIAPSSESPGDLNASQTITGGTGTGGSGSEGWTYQVDNSVVDFLGENDSVILTYTVTVDDNRGGTDTDTVTITVNGTNDAPVITNDPQTGTITESADVVGGADADPAGVAGTITYDDVDLSDVHTVDHDGGVVSDATLANGLTLTPAQESALLAGFSLDAPASGPAIVFINEIHYDNTGGDTGEFIEVAGSAGTDLSGWTLVLYNGNGGSVYDTINLTGTIDDESNGFGALDFQLPSNGLQNGSPDGVALVDNNGTVIEFLSYEGSFVANGGAADGMTSTDIGVTEPGSTPVGQSLQRTGTGSESADFTWSGPAVDSPGDLNASQTISAATPNVFINEIHYDNAGGDVGEFIEVAGTAGTDLSGWSLVLYNGSNGEVYRTVSLSGTIDNESNGLGALSFDLPTNGLQNGAPDGTALVDNNDNVIEFLSYEGTLTANGGPADGMTSTDIGVEESSGTPVGQSLQRTGTGSESADFTWSDPAEDSPGDLNASQMVPAGTGVGSGSRGWSYEVDNSVIDFLGENDSVELTFTVTVDDQNGGTDTDTVTITVNGTNDAPEITSGPQSGTIEETADNAPGADADPADATGTITFEDVDLSDSHDVSHDGGVISGKTLANGYSLTTAQEDALKAAFSLDAASMASGSVFINEIHYDNTGGDTGEFIEVAGSAGTDLSGWTLVLYNGNGGSVYDTINLTGTIDDESNGFGALDFQLPSNGLQNGSPDGVALVDNNGTVIEFLSYEGSFVANGGAADGMTSTDIGVSETSSTPIGESLQRIGTGTSGADFTWSGPSGDSPGDLNAGQSYALATATGGSGSRGWTYSIANGDIDFLGANDSVELEYTITVDDGNGGQDTATVTITVNGTNDAPIIDSGAQTGTIEESVDSAPGADADPAEATGTITFDDVDLSDAPVATHDGGTITNNTTLANGYTLTAAQEAALKAAFSLDAGGVAFSSVTGEGSQGWTYDIANADIDFLGENDSVVLEFVVTIDDQNGGTDTQTVTITVNGTNDAPIIDSGAQTGTIEESVDSAPGADADPAEATGTITFDDADLSDEHVATHDGGTITNRVLANGYTLTAAQEAALKAAFSLDAGGVAFSSVTGEGSQGWTYDIANADIDFLGENDSVVLEFVVTIDDQNGGTDTQTVTITVNGTNDVPIIDSPPQTGTIEETVDSAPAADADPAEATGTITFDDVDLSDAPVATHDGGTITNNTTLANGYTLTPAQAAALKAAFSLDAGGVAFSSVTGEGAQGWTYDIANADIDFLGDTDSVELEFVVTIDDQNGGTDTQTVTITVNGTNDVPIPADDAPPVVNQFGDQSPGVDVAGNALANDTDVDRSDVLRVTKIEGSVSASDVDNGDSGTAIGTYGKLEIDSQGNFEYTIDDDLTAQKLSPGETGVDEFTYTFTDDNGATVTAKIEISILGQTGYLIDGVVVEGRPGGVTEYFRFANTTGLDRDTEEGSSRMPLLTTMPMYTGVALPGQVIRISIVGPGAELLGEMMVNADESGNWIAKFGNLELGDFPYTVEVETLEADWDGLRPVDFQTFYAPSLHGTYGQSDELSVSSIFGRYLSRVALEGVKEANENPGGGLLNVGGSRHLPVDVRTAIGPGKDENGGSGQGVEAEEEESSQGNPDGTNPGDPDDAQ